MTCPGRPPTVLAMIVCPVCEHPQDKGDTCDVCGKRLVVAAPTSEQYPTLPELEATAIVARNAVGPPVTMMPELDLHRVGHVEVQPEKVAELEATAIPGASAPVTSLEAVPDLERTRVIDGDARTVLGPTVGCRYCGHVQARTNILCERCANAMPRIVTETKGKAEGPPKRACGNCGVDAELGKKCPSCGVYQRVSEG